MRLTPSGLIKLVDFGLFKQGTDNVISTRLGLTPAYAPVEQHPLHPGHTDQRSDIYSLGATLYHLLTGQMPVSSFDRIQAHPDPLVSPGRLNPRLSPHVAAAVSKAMSLKPDDRYRDIAAFQQALMGQQVRQQVQVRQQAMPPTPKQHPAPAGKRSTAPKSSFLYLVTILVLIIPVSALILFLTTTFLPPLPPVVVLQTIAPTAAPAAIVPPTIAPTIAPTVAPNATPQPAWVPEMVAVPAGDFLMGSTDQQVADAISQGASADWIKNENPQHSLTLPAYEIGKTEVTNAQFRPFVEGDGYTTRTYWDDAGWYWRTEQQRTQPGCWTEANFNGDHQPVVCVTWYEALAYARWLSAQTGQDFRLPTEAEWEKAARGSNGLIYPWGNTWDAKRANSSEAGSGKTTAVGQDPNGASPYGALDMAGNVWEWTRSVYTSYPYNPTDGRENLSDPAQKRFTLRGGSWDIGSLYLRVASRFNYSPAYDYPHVGVRLARHP